MPPRFSDHPLTGRTNELARARDALSDGGSLVVEGPGGAGRSRLWEAACDLVRTEGSRVVAAVATEATRTIALAPFAGLVPRSRPSDPTLLLQGVVDEIRARGSSVGLVLAVDDAHLLDATSLALLTHALREAGCTLLLTRADDTETPNGLQPVLDHRRVSRLPLAPLARDDCAELTRHALGEVGQDVLDELWRVTQGNPLMLRELLAEGSDFVGRDDEGRWRVVGDLSGSRLRDLVRRRVGTLPPALHRSLDVLAVGAPVSYDVLVRAIGPEQFSALHDAGFAETVRSDEGPVVRAAHPLYGPVYAGQAGEARRRRAKALLVEAARLAPGSTDPLRVAHWHRDSGETVRPDVIVAGARAALARYDGASAEDLVRPVLGVVEHGHSVLAAALAQQGRFVEAEDAYAVAAVEADADARPGEPSSAHACEVASARAFNLAFSLGRSPEAQAVLVQAADRQPSAVLRSRLDAERGVVAALGGDFALAAEASGSTIANPEATGAPLASAYVSHTLAQSMRGRCTGFTELSEAGLAAADAASADLPVARDQIEIMQAHALLAAGSLPEAVRLATRGVASGGPTTPAAVPWANTLSIVHATAGRLEQACASAEAGRQAAVAADPFGLHDQSVALLAMARGQGDSGAERPASPTPCSGPLDPRVSIWSARGRAWALSADGDQTSAAEEVLRAGRAGTAGQHVTWGVLALHDAVRFGLPDVVRGEILRSVADTEGALLLEAMGCHAVALAAEEAEELSVVATRFAEHGAWLLAAEAQAQHAALLATRGTSAEPEVAWSVALSLAWQARCTGARTPALRARPAIGLSGRQLEIAADAARGASSAEIGRRHVISVRTVDNHLGRIYRVLGLDGRGELAERLGPVLLAGRIDPTVELSRGPDEPPRSRRHDRRRRR